MATGAANIRRARPLLGTFVEIAVASAAPHDAEAAVEAAFRAVAHVHRLMSFHEPHSDVSRLNREAFAQPVLVNAHTYRVLEIAIDLHRRSAGLFDIATAPALQRLGVLPGVANAAWAAPSVAERDTPVELLEDRRVRFRQANVRIDLGGIAKGYAVDCAVGVLQSRGVASGLVNAGGDMMAFGLGAESVHIRDPRRLGEWLCRVNLCNQALASTGSQLDPFNTTESATTTVIDPASQRPAREIHGATVRASSCTIADGLTKVVMLAGEQSAALLEHYGASAMFIGLDGEVCVTADWLEAVPLAA